MAKYVLCPRCELNYILEGEEYCDVCKAELKIGPQLMFSVDGDVKDQVLCPICKHRYIDEGEDMCEQCREQSYHRQEEDLEDGDEWRKFLDDDEKEIISSKGDDEEDMVSLSQIEEEELLDGEFEDDEDIDPYTNEKVTDSHSDDDFDYVTVNEEDFLDDEDEEDDEDDDE